MKRISGRDFYHIVESVTGKKVIVYGTGRYAAEIIQKLKCLGVKVEYCVDDDLSDVVVTGIVCDIYTLLLEEEVFYVLIAKSDVKYGANVLRGLGLKYLKDYSSFFLAAGKLIPENTFALDPLFGYSMPYEETRGRGVKVYGDINKAECTIAILGGSTSDPCAYPWKSWGELLYEKGCSEEKKLAVVVGAVCGYSSSEELLKLIRDMLPLKPDIVVSYSGVNDRGTIQSYINSYQKKLYEHLASQQQKGVYGLGEADSVCWGVTERIESWQKWVRNQQMMYHLTKMTGIRYIAFLQPTVISKKRGKRDEELYLYIGEDEISDKIQYYKKVRQLIDCGELEYVVDASGWFDDIDGLFYDYCHVFEEGNQLIAERIYRHIFGGECRNGIFISD